MESNKCYKACHKKSIRTYTINVSMLDIKFIRENPGIVQKAAKDKNIEINIDHIVEIDAKKRELQITLQKLQEERNSFTKSIKGKPTPEQIEKGKEIREKTEKHDAALKAVEV